MRGSKARGVLPSASAPRGGRPRWLVPNMWYETAHGWRVVAPMPPTGMQGLLWFRPHDAEGHGAAVGNGMFVPLAHPSILTVGLEEIALEEIALEGLRQGDYAQQCLACHEYACPFCPVRHEAACPKA